jgi:hypothetical protein
MGLGGSLPVSDLLLVHNRKTVRISDGIVFVITAPLRYSRVGVKGNINSLKIVQNRLKGAGGR